MDVVRNKQWGYIIISIKLVLEGHIVVVLVCVVYINGRSGYADSIRARESLIRARET